MGLLVTLEREDGECVDRVADPGGVLYRLLPAGEDNTYQMLRFVDWYGDTTFNHLQMEVLLSEISRLRHAAKSAEELELLHHIEAMAHRCKEQGDVYLKFYGD